nr:MAG TPA: hypothetical protein [Caudoviricetes sp.]
MPLDLILRSDWYKVTNSVPRNKSSPYSVRESGIYNSRSEQGGN